MLGISGRGRRRSHPRSADCRRQRNPARCSPTRPRGSRRFTPIFNNTSPSPARPALERFHEIETNDHRAVHAHEPRQIEPLLERPTLTSIARDFPSSPEAAVARAVVSAPQNRRTFRRPCGPCDIGPRDAVMHEPRPGWRRTSSQRRPQRVVGARLDPETCDARLL